MRSASRRRPDGRLRILAIGLCISLAACSGGEPGPARAPNLLLLCVDTLRADHLGAWGHGLETSPHLDRFAASGVRFSDASVQWTKTWPSMASMLTGQYPTRTGIRYAPRRPLPERNVTLAEILRDAGYRTGAVVANANLSRTLGFDQGFDHYVESWMEEYRRLFGDEEFRNRAGLTKRLTNAKRVVDSGLAWIDSLGAEDVADGQEPFFLWLHFIDPHGPYVPPPPHHARFREDYPVQRVPVRAIPPYQRHRAPGGGVIDDLGFYKARYDGEIRRFDDELARLLHELEQRGLRRDTLIVLTADHGESLDEHGYFLEHGALPYQPTAHVPLVLVWEERLPEGIVIPQPVGLVDLVPTLLDLLEVRAPEDLAGRSLVPLVEGSPEAAPRYVFLEAGVRQPSQRAVRKGPWKLVHFRAEEDRRRLGKPEWVLHHLERDPEEQVDLAAQYADLVAELQAALEEYARTGDGPGGAKAEDDEESVGLEQLDRRTREQLRALGYIDDAEEAPPDADEEP